MPNWCYQRMAVAGGETELRRFVDAITVPNITDSEFSQYDLNHLDPCPDELINTKSGFFAVNLDGTPNPQQVALEEQQNSNLSKYGFKDWYDRNNTVWGSKWGACEVSMNYTSYVPESYVRPSPVAISSFREYLGDEATEEYVSSIENTNDTNTGLPVSVVELFFESAWSPVDGLIQTISGQFPTLIFGVSMTEEANFFAGYFVFQNKEATDWVEYDIAAYLRRRQRWIDEQTKSGQNVDAFDYEEEEDIANDLWDKVLDIVRHHGDGIQKGI